MLPPAVWMYIGIFSTALATILLGLLLWRRRELRRYEAIEAAGTLQEWGLELFAKMLLAYAVGNYFGRDSVTRIARQIIESIKTEGLPAMLAKVFWKLLDHFVKDPERAARIRKVLDAAKLTVD